MLSAAGEPTLADWLQGWGTVAGSVFAALAAIAAVAVLRHDRMVRRQEDAESAMAQARTILVRSEADWDAGMIESASFTVHNFSDNIIFDITYGIRRRDHLAHHGSTLRMEYLPPGEASPPHVFKLDPPLPVPDDDMMPPDLLPTRVVFTDAAGRRWRRDSRSQPVRLGPEDDADVDSWLKADD